MKDMICICDFDGTITKKDAINDFLENFADKKWRDIEDRWVKGEIKTSDAMKLQFALVKNFTQEKVDLWFKNVELDNYFKEFYDFCKKKNLKLVIVSDGFEYFIQKILSNYGISDIEIYSNHIEYKDGQFIMNFPYANDNCKRQAGTCKCSFIKKFKETYKTVIYVGDGASDFCPAQNADLLFAKEMLLGYCLDKGIKHIKYNNFRDILENDFFRKRR